MRGYSSAGECLTGSQEVTGSNPVISMLLQGMHPSDGHSCGKMLFQEYCCATEEPEDFSPGFFHSILSPSIPIRSLGLFHTRPIPMRLTHSKIFLPFSIGKTSCLSGMAARRNRSYHKVTMAQNCAYFTPSPHSVKMKWKTRSKNTGTYNFPINALSDFKISKEDCYGIR